LIVVPPV